MLPPRLDVRGVSATSAASAAPAVAAPRQEAFQRALSQMVGQTLPAQVLSKFSDGSFLVRVADTNARMLLPNGINTGDELPLTVVSGQPRATLQVGAGSPQAGQMATFVAGDQMPEMPGDGRLPSQEAAILNLSGKQPQAAEAEGAHPGQAAAAQAQGGRALSPGAALLSKAPLVPADQLPSLGKDTPQAALSPAARAIASALASAYTAPGVPVTINGKTPLSTGGPPDTGKLSEGLQRALGDSGLFYESHVAEWAEGKRSLQDLQREPQMQRQAATQGQADAMAKTLAGPDLSAAQMINQQLHTHEQGKVMWQGEAWPGQQMQWLVERDQQQSDEGGQGARREGRDGDGADSVWRSGVRFRFPMLGKVAANVTLVGDQVHISVQSGSEDTAATLRAWAGALQQAMDAAGAPLTSLAINAEANDGAS
ncbi:flagellar hook-length control protein FliK [Pseudoduganella eburnea]|uniref:Flagellar hook-length control protein FliK n=1 Tax=Massilia eburnea TaxID=1776165 RepID=A0A6L6QEZ5_9BURK|nr:flagellar hook-length control protein FliK [Massilia eburnea]MTW11068.1 flagellar hook-length control protein FliK [Massilia eburnea]